MNNVEYLEYFRKIFEGDRGGGREGGRLIDFHLRI